MSQWKKVKIGDFLVQYRITIHVQDDKDYKQVTISSKDGVKFRCIKNGKDIGRKRQFLIDLKKYPKTVVFTRQGLHEGSIGIAPDNVDGCIATENMPMFAVNEDIIHSKYLQYLLKSQIFSDLVATLTPTGSAQKAIHERDLLPLEILIPDLPEQERIASEISQKLEKIEQLSSEIEKQKSYAKQLRANILQDAIEGKLSADWREKHPVKKGAPDYDAEALFEKIQIEKQEKGKKQKPLPAITEDEKPFAIPTNWKWVRLGEIIDSIVYGTSAKCSYDSKQNARILRIPNVSSGYINDDDLKFTNLTASEKQELSLKENDVLVIRSNGSPEIVGKMICVPQKFEGYCYAGYLIRLRFSISQMGFFIAKVSASTSMRAQVEDPLRSTVGINNINTDEIKNLIVPLPPLAEQKEIVICVENHLETITQLETQIATRETLTKQLMQGLLKDAFEEA